MSSPNHSSSHIEVVDVAVIGGSAAGLAAALQLLRQRRSVMVIDDGTPRNAPAAHLHGYLGFDGRPPSDLVAAGRTEVATYGGVFVAARVTHVDGDATAGFTVRCADGTTIHARRLVLATGLSDELPEIDGVADLWGDRVIHCPFCHGFEHSGGRHVHIVTFAAGLHPVPLFAHLAETMTVVVDPGAQVPAEVLDAVRATDAEVIDAAAVAVAPDGDVLVVTVADGRRLIADVVSVTPTVRARVDVVESLGVSASAHPMGIGSHLVVDPTGRTAVPGVFAAGNVVDPSHQLLQAAADGARIGAMVAFDLAA